jgi:aldose 1-epimerase
MARDASAPPSGRQVALRHGPWTAVVVEVGGGLRELAYDGRPLLDGYGPGEMASGGRGQPLLPWPNRLAGGRYRAGGREVRAPVNEPSTGSAIHGLTRWANWSVAGDEGSRCAMALRLHPQPAYPFLLDLRLDYALSDDGLDVRLTAANAGAQAAPFGAGFHPYLSAGTPTVDDARLTLPAAEWLPADARGIPTGERRPVAGELDLRDGGPLGPATLDNCFGALARDPDGLARVVLEGPTDRVTLWMDALWGFVMVFTGDTLSPERRRRGLAVEPMTCPADAFNSGDGVLTIPPGGSVEGRWGISRADAGRSAHP